MTLVDTSVWIDHLRNNNRRLAELLEKGLVCTHPFIIGELACGSMRNRREVLGLLVELPRATSADDAEVLEWLDSGRLYGRGIGWVDVHLLAAAHLTGCPLWTFDRRLSRVAAQLRLSA